MPISKNMNTKNKNAKQCAANSYTPQGLGIALVQSQDVFTKEILQKYTDLSRKQVKTSNNPISNFRFMERQIKKDTRRFILHLDDEDLLSFVNYLQDKLTNFNKYRKIFKGVQLFATLSTSDDVRFRVKSTTYVKELMQFHQSPLSQVLLTFEPGDVGASSEEPVKKTILVVLSDKETSYFNQVDAYFKDTSTSKVKKIRVSELPVGMDFLGIFEVVLFLDNIEEMNKVARFLNVNNFLGALTVVNPTKGILNESELQKLLAKKGVKGKSVFSGVKNNVEENKYLEYSKPCDKQVLEMISVQWYEDDEYEESCEDLRKELGYLQRMNRSESNWYWDKLINDVRNRMRELNCM
jgi:hypothetical protein